MNRFRIFTFAFALITTLVICAENTMYSPKPFLEEGKAWKKTYRMYTEDSGLKEIEVMCTVQEMCYIDNMALYPISVTSDDTIFEPYDMYYKEDNGIVSEYYGNDNFGDLYNFNVSIGETVIFNKSSNPENYVVTDCSIINVKNIERRMITLKSQDLSKSVIWIEGIGGYDNRDEMTTIDAPIGTQYGSMGHFLECYEDGKCVFSASDFKVLSNMVDINQEETDVDNLIKQYDINGLILDKSHKGSLYISNGKKHIYR